MIDFFFRYLQEEEGEDDETDNSTILKTTLRIYGSLFAGFFLVFLYVRRRYPRVYNLRNDHSLYTDWLLSPLAAHDYGTLGWIVKIFTDVGEGELLEHCGLDAVASLRLLHRIGFHVALVGAFNSLYLIPIYATSPPTQDNEHIEDFLEKAGLGNVPANSARMVATVIASYLVFGMAMWRLYQEWEWFIKQRHLQLASLRVESYSILVQWIPPELQSSEALEYYFSGGNDNVVLDVQLGLKIPALETMVRQREVLRTKRDHLIAIYNRSAENGEGSSSRCGCRQKIDIGNLEESIQSLNQDLSELEGDIVKAVAALDTKRSVPVPTQQEENDDDALEKNEMGDTPPNQTSTQDHSTSLGLGEKEEKSGIEVESSLSTPLKACDDLLDSRDSTQNGSEVEKEGQPRDAAFVTFTSLEAASSALRMIQHQEPYALVTNDAPPPNGILWRNLGAPRARVETLRVTSFLLTTILCIFWTVPVTLVQSFAEVSSLKERWPALGEATEKYPMLETLLEQIAPLLLLGLNALLPILLKLLAALEGHLGESAVQSSLFKKFAAFQIIQTFLVTTISGSTFSIIEDIIDEGGFAYTVRLLAAAIPAASAFFMQLVLVQVFLGAGTELLRVYPLLFAFFRRFVGPNITEKERNTVFVGLKPLSHPPDAKLYRRLANFILHFQIMMVYSVMNPATSYALLFTFAILSLTWRHQAIYIYPETPCGMLWAQAAGIMIHCMVLAQILLVAVLILKQGVVAAILLCPLIFMTIIFGFYMSKRHFTVAKFLPRSVCMSVDSQRLHKGPTTAWRGEYIQPELRTARGLENEVDHESSESVTL